MDYLFCIYFKIITKSFLFDLKFINSKKVHPLTFVFTIFNLKFCFNETRTLSINCQKVY